MADRTISGELERLAGRVVKLEGDSHELGEIRATLLVNFGAGPRNHYGFCIEDRGSTLSMMVLALKTLTEK